MLGRRLPGQRQRRMAGCSRDVQRRGKREPGASPGDLKGQKSVRSTVAEPDFDLRSQHLSQRIISTEPRFGKC